MTTQLPKAASSYTEPFFSGVKNGTFPASNRNVIFFPLLFFSSNCFDIWATEVCQEKLANDKCFKRKVRNNCALTCETCWKGREAPSVEKGGETTEQKRLKNFLLEDYFCQDNKKNREGRKLSKGGKLFCNQPSSLFVFLFFAFSCASNEKETLFH